MMNYKESGSYYKNLHFVKINTVKYTGNLNRFIKWSQTEKSRKDLKILDLPYKSFIT